MKSKTLVLFLTALAFTSQTAFAQSQSAPINLDGNFKEALEQIKALPRDSQQGLLKQAGADIATFKQEIAQFEKQIKLTEFKITRSLSKGEQVSQSASELTIPIAISAGIAAAVSGLTVFTIAMEDLEFREFKLLWSRKSGLAWTFWVSVAVGTAAVANKYFSQKKIQLVAGKELAQISELRKTIDLLSSKVTEREKFIQLLSAYLTLD
ncbi:MAG: hypothetical protein K2X47_03385 [Bdellovibrionales bacterium]|nr:hypothetical protein [Bdellovibrionales bacterium]